MANNPYDNQQVQGAGADDTWLGSLGTSLGTTSAMQAKNYQVDPEAASWYANGGRGMDDLRGEENDYRGLGSADRGYQLQDRQAMLDQANALRNVAAGHGPSAAEGMMQENSARAQQNSMAAARMASGNPADQAAALRNASTGAAQATNSVGAQIGQVKAQEMLNAQQQLSGLLGQTRGQDLQSQGMNQSMQGAYLGAGQQATAAQLQAQMARQGLNSNNFNTAQGLNAGIDQNNAANNKEMLSAIMSTVGSMMAGMMSDENLKTEIEDEGDHATEGLRSSLASDNLSPAPQLASLGALEAKDDDQKYDWNSFFNKAVTPAPSSGGGGMGGMSSMMSGMMGGGEGGMMSDERLKTDVRKTEADSFLDSLHPKSFRYKDPQDEPVDNPRGDRYLGILAQDVERSPTGRTIVTETPRGKAIEGPSMLSALAAGVGRLNERTSQLEAKRK